MNSTTSTTTPTTTITTTTTTTGVDRRSAKTSRDRNAHSPHAVTTGDVIPQYLYARSINNSLVTQQTKVTIEPPQHEKKQQSSKEFFKELKKQRKKEDLEVLYQMWKVISQYKKEDTSLENVIKKLSFLSGGNEGISTNYNYDKETYTIRNKYGYKQRNLGGRENPSKEGRIDFERLYRVNAILENGTALPLEVEKDIILLEKKILYILSKELEELKGESFLESSKTKEILQLEKQNGDISDFETITIFVDKHYRQAVLNKIKAEISQFKDFILQDKDHDKNSIYFFARKMIIVGELCHELEEDIKDDKELKELRKLFGALNLLRVGFVHSHSKILFNLTPTKTKEVDQFLQQFIVLFNQLLSEDIFLSCANNPKELDQCIKNITGINRKLLASSKYKLQYQLEEEVLKAKYVLDILESKEYKDVLVICEEINKSNQLPKFFAIVDESKKSGNVSYLFKIEDILNNSKLDEGIKNKLKNCLETLEKYIKNGNFKGLKDRYKLMIEDEECKEFLQIACGELFNTFDVSDLEQVKDILEREIYPLKELITIGERINILKNELKIVENIKSQYNEATAKQDKTMLKKCEKSIVKLYGEANALKSYPKMLGGILLKVPQISAQLQEVIQLLSAELNNWISLLTPNCKKLSEKLNQLSSLALSSISVELDKVCEKLDHLLNHLRDYLPNYNINAIDNCINLFQQTVDTLTNPKVSMPGLLSINKKFLDIKKEVQNLDEQDRDMLLERFSFKMFPLEEAQTQEIDDLAKMIVLKSKHSDKLLSLLEKINKEMKYLSETEKNDKLDKTMKDAVMEQIVTVLGQYVRDLDELQLPPDQVLPSRILKEAGITAKMARSKGLAHEVLYFSQDKFLKNLYEDILPAQQDFQAIYTINKDSVASIQKTALVFNGLGQAFMRLCFFNDAVQCFEDARAELLDNPYLENTIYPRSKIDQLKLDAMDITQPTAICIDMTQLIFGIDSCELDVVSNLVNAYIGSGKIDKAQEIAVALLDRVNINEIKQYKETLVHLSSLNSEINQDSALIVKHLEENNPHIFGIYQKVIQTVKSIQAPFVLYYPEDTQIFDQISSIINSIGKAYYQEKKFKEADESFDQAFSLSGTQDHAVSILVNRAQCYQALQETTTAKKFIQEAIEKGNIASQFLGRVILCEIELEEGQAILDNINHLESFYNQKKGDLKTAAGDKYSEYLLRFYSVKLRILAAKDGDRAIEQFHKHEKQNIEQLDIKDKKKLSYLSCRVLTSFILPRKLNINGQEILNNAQIYFNYASAIPGNIQSEEKITAHDLAVAYSNYAEQQQVHLSDRKLMYFQKALDLQEKYSLETIVTLVNLGVAHHNRAESLYGKKKKEETTEDYKKTISYIERIQSLNSAEGFHILGSSYSRLGVMEKNPEYLEKAMGYLKKAVSLDPIEPLYRNTMKDCQKEHANFLEKQKLEKITDANSSNLNKLLSRYNFYVKNKNKGKPSSSFSLMIDRIENINAFTAFLNSIGIPSSEITVQSNNNVVVLKLKEESIKIVQDLSQSQKESRYS